MADIATRDGVEMDNAQRAEDVVGAHHTRVYRKGVLEAEDFPVADVSDYLEQDDTVIWIDLCGPSDDQLHELAGELGLHELAVEDALEHQRPKLDHYASLLFLSVPRRARRRGRGAASRTPRSTRSSATVGWSPCAQDEGFSMEPVLQRWDRSPDLARNGVELPVVRLARCGDRRALRRGAGVRRVLRRGQRHHLLGDIRSPRPNNGTGSRCAARW